MLPLVSSATILPLCARRFHLAVLTSSQSEVAMAPHQDHEPTLMGIPQELVLRILECLFENEEAEISNGSPEAIGNWPLAILETCHLLNIQGKKAMRTQLAKCGLHYNNDLPPEAENHHGYRTDDQYYEIHSKQIQFLKQYGEPIKKVSTYDIDCWGEFSLHWFPNVELLELSACRYSLRATKDDGAVEGGKLNKARLLQLCRTQFYEAARKECGINPAFRELIRNIKKGVDRNFTILAEMPMSIDEVGFWVSFALSCVEPRANYDQDLLFNVDTKEVQFIDRNPKTKAYLLGWQKVE